MDLPIVLGKDVQADFKIVGGKFVLSIEFDGADAVIDALKTKVPTWLGPILDLAKKEVDSL